MALSLSPCTRPGSRRPRSGPLSDRWLRRLHGESGQASAEHAGVIVVVVLLVLALAAGFTPLGARIASGIQCTVASVFSDGGGGGCGDESAQPVTVGRSESESSSGGSGVGASASGPGDSGSPQGAPQNGKPQRKPQEPVDRAKVGEALKRTREALKSGWFDPVKPEDLEEVERQLAGLNGAEVDAFIAGMSDDELRTWVSEMEKKKWGPFGTDGWSTERRQQMWSRVLPDASYETVRRLAGFSHDIQPRIDDVEGDSANSKGKGNGFSYLESNGTPYVDGVSPTDIRQGALGDCWYIAALKSVAAADPSVIENAITDNGNGTYTVRLYHDGKPVDITVTGDEVINRDGKQGFARSTDTGEKWPQIMEKALAAYEGSYGAIEGGSAGIGMEVITGKPSTFTPTSDVSAADLKAELDRGHAVTLHSQPKPRWPWWPNRTDPLYDPKSTKDPERKYLWEPLAYSHAYQVTAVDLADPNDPSDDTVTVQNPWYPDKPMTLPYEEWKRGFSGVFTNPVK